MDQCRKEAADSSTSLETLKCPTPHGGRFGDHKGITFVLLCQVLAHLLRPPTMGCFSKENIHNSCLFGTVCLDSVGITAAVLWLLFTIYVENSVWYSRHRGHILAICHAAVAVKDAMEVHRYPEAVWINAIFCCTLPSVVSSMGHSSMWPELFTRLSAQVFAFASILFLLDDQGAIGTNLPMLTATSLASGLFASCSQGESWTLEINPLQYMSEGRIPFPSNTESSIEASKLKGKTMHDDELFLEKEESLVSHSPLQMEFSDTDKTGKLTKGTYRQSSIATESVTSLSAPFSQSNDELNRSLHSSTFEKSISKQEVMTSLDGYLPTEVPGKETFCLHCKNVNSEAVKTHESSVDLFPLVFPYKKKSTARHAGQSAIHRSFNTNVIRNIEVNVDALGEEAIDVIKLACEAISAVDETAETRLAAEHVVAVALRVAELERQVMEVKVLEAKEAMEKAMTAVTQATQVNKATMLQLNGAIAGELIRIASFSRKLQEEDSGRWFGACTQAMEKVSLSKGVKEGIGASGRVGERSKGGFIPGACFQEIRDYCPNSVDNSLYKIDRKKSLEEAEPITSLPKQLNKILKAVNLSDMSAELSQIPEMGEKNRIKEGLGLVNHKEIQDCMADMDDSSCKKISESNSSSQRKPWLPAPPGRRIWREVKLKGLVCRTGVKVPAAKVCVLLARQRAVEAAIWFERFCPRSSLPDEFYMQAEVEMEEHGYGEAVKAWRQGQGETKALELMRNSTFEGDISAAIIKCRNSRLELTALGVVAARSEPWLALERRHGQPGLLFAPIEASLPTFLCEDITQKGKEISRVGLDVPRSSWLAKHVSLSELLEGVLSSIKPPLGPGQKNAVRAVGRDMDRVEADIALKFEELCKGMGAWIKGGDSTCELDPLQGAGALISTMGERVEGFLLEAADRHFQLFEFCRAVLVPAQMRELIFGLSEQTCKLGHVSQFWEMSHEFIKLETRGD